MRTFLLWILVAGTVSHQLEPASQVVLKVEYDLRTKELIRACENKEKESYSTDRKVDVQNRASVSLPTIEFRHRKFDNNSSLVILASGVRGFGPFNSSK